MATTTATDAGKPARKTSYNNGKQGNKKKINKNPYAELGREKFSALVVELQEKKQKILSQMGNDSGSLVRFTYSDEDNKLKPIVVLGKEHNKEGYPKSGSFLEKVAGDQPTLTTESAAGPEFVATAPAKDKAKQPPAAPTTPPPPAPAAAAAAPVLIRNSKNPYANIGLERFSALLAELEERKQKILSQHKPEQVLLVRFCFSGDNELKPIVVTPKGKKEGKVKIDKNAAAAAKTEKQRISHVEDQEPEEEAKKEATKQQEAAAGKGEELAAEVAEMAAGAEVGACEEWRVYNHLRASDCGCAIVIVVLVVLFLALYEKYRSTVYLLRLCQRLD
ncbi:hypothetical protein Dimus_028060 [Dionaea muscipula]